MSFLADIDNATAAESLLTLKRNFELVPKVYRAQLLRDQENVLLQLAGKCPLLNQSCVDKLHFRAVWDLKKVV